MRFCLDGASSRHDGEVGWWGYSSLPPYGVIPRTEWNQACRIHSIMEGWWHPSSNGSECIHLWTVRGTRALRM